MTLIELSIWCHHFNIRYESFLSLRGLSAPELRAATLELKKISILDFDNSYARLEAIIPTLDTSNILYPGHAFYPREFLEIDEPPVFLMVEGEYRHLQRPKISVVGTRRPDETFLLWLDTELKSFLELSGAAVVSGGAWGVDQKASQVALRCGQPTIMVLPSGLLAPYPATIKSLFQGLNVLFLTEYFPNQGMQKSHFIRRNRLISALGRILFAVQFEVKSGTMITVNYGLAQNKEIVTLPDHPLCFKSSGNLKIIKQGAQVISTGVDLAGLWDALPQ